MSLISTIENMLQPAINLGLAESDFWEMTKAEVERYMEGAVWRIKSKAQLDYVLADLIGMSIGRMLDSKNTFPTIEKAYPTLFSEEDKKAAEEEARTVNSVNSFLAFAQRHNAKLNKGVENR